MNTILIARHGNTFDLGDTVVRVGGRTDMSLSNSGILQAEHIGMYLKHNRIYPVAVFTSTLRRTIETATIALAKAQLDIPIQQLPMFNEIDYGPDEGKTEEEVIGRIGDQAIHDWNKLAVVPDGWVIDPMQIVNDWKMFADLVRTEYAGSTVLVVTSNGIARFAPYLTHHFLAFSEKHNIKLSTGCLASLSYIGENWKIDYWNERPE